MLSLPRSRRCGYSKKKKKKKRATFTGLLMRNTHSHCVRWRAGINTCVSLWSLMCEWVKGKLTRKNPPWSHPGPCSGLWIHPLYELLTTCLCFPYQTWNKHALKLRFPANALLTLLYIFLSFFLFFFPRPGVAYSWNFCSYFTGWDIYSEPLCCFADMCLLVSPTASPTVF